MSGALALSLATAEAILLGLGFREATPRVCPDQRETRPSERFVVDENVGWRMRPNHSFGFETDGEVITYQSDTSGFRVPSEDRPFSNPGQRLAVIGDSFGWGYGVEFEESLTGLLQEALPEVEVQNFAMPGFGLDQIWLSQRYWALPFKPEVVIAVVYPDDFERSLSAFRISEGFAKPAYHLRNGKLVERTAKDCPPPVTRLVEKHSRIFALFRRFERRMAREHGTGDWWSLNASILDQMIADSKKAGVDLILVHVPYPSFLPFQSLTDHMGGSEATFIDLGEDFAGDPESFYFPSDGHLNPLGHRRMAERVRLAASSRLEDRGDLGGGEP